VCKRQPAFWQAIFSGLLVLNAVIQIYFVSRQLKNATTATEISRQSLVAAQRAYLSYGLVEQEPYGIKIHIANLGHVPARITGVHFTFGRVRLDKDGATVLDTRTVESNALNSVVMPSPVTDFGMIVTLPVFSSDDRSAIDAGTQNEVVDGRITFEVELDDSNRPPITDTLAIHTGYDHLLKNWSHIDEGLPINFREAQRR
jgi:hypothetical protein